ncbi:hypothetical protein SAY86_023311 [Trapa natans]|uniref:Uncharacterized protein n=1 Tax=Trapa natans TaxID=22666 RepID=A0AAN7MA65_TRANT|nr:hypothetical protein SAY86_023311 [Trapa natans]
MTSSDKLMYEEEIKKLLHENSFLHSALQRHGGEKNSHTSVELHVQLLVKRLQEMEDKQSRMFGFLAELMKNPRFAYALLDQSGDPGDKRRVLELDEAELNWGAGATPVLDFSWVQKLDTSMNTWNSFLQSVGQRMAVEEGGNIGSSSKSMMGAILAPAPGESSGDSERNISAWSPPESPELCPSLDQEESPTRSSVQQPNVDIGLRSSVMEGNSKPSNDVFWEQFLEEAARPSDHHQEVQSVRAVDEADEACLQQQGKFWWSSHYVTDFLKPVGTRTLDERT